MKSLVPSYIFDLSIVNCQHSCYFYVFPTTTKNIHFVEVHLMNIPNKSEFG